MAIFTTILAICFLMILSGCESSPTEVEDYEPEPMLTAFLFNGEPVDSIVFEEVGDLEALYLPGQNAISGADIYVIALPEQDTLFFNFDAGAGVYRPTNAAAWGVPQGNKQYRVEAHKPSEDLYLWAETVIPETFSLTVSPAPVGVDPEGIAFLDTMTREDPNIEMEWTDSSPIGGYVIPVTCLNEDYVPLDPDFDPIEDDIPDDSSLVSFDLVLPNFNYRQLPWILFQYEGWHEIQVQAADPEYWLYFFSVFRLYMGQVTNVEYNVNGGIGIVAGLARNKFKVYVEKVE